jgi:sialidase-1
MTRVQSIAAKTNNRTRTHSLCHLLLAMLTFAGFTAWGETIVPPLQPGYDSQWIFARGEWRMGDGFIEQTNASGGSAAILTSPAFSDFTLSVDFSIARLGSGVRAASIIFRATGTMTYYWLHLDSENAQAILVRSTRARTWIEIKRQPLHISNDTWHTARIECRGPKIAFSLDNQEVFLCEDSTIRAGCVGLGTSEGQVRFRNLKIEGEIVPMEQPLQHESPLYKIISRGEASGPYQAFPDACRLNNGDILCVFYAGYGHVSLPNDQWPKGGRICMVRSSDEGRTWTEPRILYDDPDDNRDPHIAQLSDGTLICSFFSLRPHGSRWELVGVQLVRSYDGGETWQERAETLVPGHACSAPVRQMPDGTLILGLYGGDGEAEWGGVIRSSDMGKTWSDPIYIGKEARLPLDAETDVILLRDGTLYAALRSSKINMHYATSPDLGLTWSPVADIGFKGHCPHFTRLSTGEILLTHRLPATSLHVSRDECKTWEGPYIIDDVGGAYPATVELKDGTVLAVYYEEGEGSAVRALRFRLEPDGIEPLPLE